MRAGRSRWGLEVGLLCIVLGGGVARASDLPAFPGAEGFGSTTPGGRGGAVVEVVNLADSGPGSLRAACQTPGARTVVFRVGGVIELASDIKISHPFITIAGQTAPGDGVCLKGATLRICTHDVVVRCMRARVGDGPVGAAPGNRDALKIEGTRVRDVVVDHCSMSWSIDECVSTWGTPRDVTVQWCIIAEALRNSRHPKGAHGMGLLVGDRSTHFTFHHNLLAHNPRRNPLIQGRGDGVNRIDWRNNVIYNFGKFCSVVRGRVEINYVANVVKRGADSKTDKELHVDRDGRNNAHPAVFVSGNLAPSTRAGALDDWLMVRDMAKLGEAALRRREPLAMPSVRTQPAAEALEAVLRAAGAIRPKRDAVDARVVDDVRKGTGAAIDSPADVGGWPAYRSAAPPADADHDGMPDAWERARGLNPADPSDRNRTAPSGYTQLEEYLNSLMSM